MAYVLWSRFLRFNSNDPHWPNRDRFILSAGHGSALLYSLLHLFGYDLPLDEIKRFRQIGSKTPGHPESTLTQGVEMTTGPLGQGFANGVGVAIAEAYLAAKFNRHDYKIIDHYTYGIVSDGDLMEGIASEAASLAGHLKLGKLIYLYDDNKISLDGPTSLSFTEDVPARFRGYGWQTLTVEDGNDLQAIESAIREAQADGERPTLISVKTIIGYGSPQAGTSKVHGNALGKENIRKTKEFFGWNPEKTFDIPEEVKIYLLEQSKEKADLQKNWNKQLDEFTKAYPEEAGVLKLGFTGVLAFSSWKFSLGKKGQHEFGAIPKPTVKVRMEENGLRRFTRVFAWAPLFRMP